MNRREIVFGDNLDYLRTVPDRTVDLIYIDPPFNTGRKQVRRRMRSFRDEENGDRVGFNGKRYRTEPLGASGWDDMFDDFVAFIEPRFRHAHRILTDRGSLLVHLDYREVHYCKVALDRIFGRDCFQNEIIWAYDYGARTRKRWAAKHDTILWYTKDPEVYTYNYDAIDRIPYMAPRLAGAEKAKRGKTPTDVWWHTIVSPSGKEKTGYATQKPRGILDRIIRVHSKAGDLVLDFFAGSGTTGEAAAEHGRDFVLVDNNPDAIDIMTKRLARFAPVRSHDARSVPPSDSTEQRDHRPPQ